MLNLQEVIIETFLNQLENDYAHTYGATDPPNGEIAVWAGRLALEQIANCDALYHNVEHTMMVTSAGLSIIQGKHMLDGGITPNDWLHFVLALLFHDIGYVRLLCKRDSEYQVATGINDETVSLPNDATDAILEPYHVDRSKLFVTERFSSQVVRHIDRLRLASYIEMTRMPQPKFDIMPAPTSLEGLVRAADSIGQLGDPGYLRKIPALFYEFSELGINRLLGYRNPIEMRQKYAGYYWKTVRPSIQDAFRYLRVTHRGKQWIANLHSHVFEVEHFK